MKKPRLVGFGKRPLEVSDEKVSMCRKPVLFLNDPFSLGCLSSK